MPKLLKKINVGNPLANFHLWEDLDRYEQIQSDEDLADFYQEMLTKYERRPLVCSFIHAMITFSTGGMQVNTEKI